MTHATAATILIVDDVPTNIQLLAESLRTDYRVLIATNGQDALDIARRTPPDLILLDVMMPEMDGFETCRALKDDPLTRHVPVIFVTARSESADETRGLELGAVDYITKPFHLAIVRARVRNHVALKQRSDLLESLAKIDALTGIANRRRFDETLESEWRRSLRTRQSIGLLMIDIDHFKRYNDHFGHGAGDRCLTTIAAVLTRSLGRPADLLARYGGEEFAIVLPDTAIEGALQLAERLGERMRSLALVHAPQADRPIVTLSIGCAAAIPADAEGAAALLAAADAKLYAAKHAGRDRVAS